MEPVKEENQREVLTNPDLSQNDNYNRNGCDIVSYLVYMGCSYYDGDQDKLFTEAHVVNPFKSSASASLTPATTNSGSFSSIASRIKSKVVVDVLDYLRWTMLFPSTL